jgi:hypothetical protein
VLRRQIERVDHEVGQCAAQRVVVTADHGAGPGPAAQVEMPAAGEQPELLADLGHDLGQVDVGLGERGSVAAGGGEQVLDQPGHPCGGPADDGGRVPALVGGDVVAGEHGVDVGLDDRERVAQLVRGVVQQPALRVEGVVEPGQHSVHCGRESAQFVVGSVQPDPAGQVAGADLLSGGRDPGHRPQGPAGQPPSDREAAGEQAAERADRVEPEGPQRVVVDDTLDIGHVGGGEPCDRRAVVLLLDLEGLGHGLGVEAVGQSEVDAPDYERSQAEQQERVRDGEPEADRSGPLGTVRAHQVASRSR